MRDKTDLIRSNVQTIHRSLMKVMMEDSDLHRALAVRDLLNATDEIWNISLELDN